MNLEIKVTSEIKPPSNPETPCEDPRCATCRQKEKERTLRRNFILSQKKNPNDSVGSER